MPSISGRRFEVVVLNSEFMWHIIQVQKPSILASLGRIKWRSLPRVTFTAVKSTTRMQKHGPVTERGSLVFVTRSPHASWGTRPGCELVLHVSSDYFCYIKDAPGSNAGVQTFQPSMQKVIAFLLLFVALCAAQVGPGTVTGNTAVHDPTMCKDSSGTYFVFCGHLIYESQHSMINFLLATGVGIEIRTSPDRTAWTYRGLVWPNGASWTDTYTGVSSGLVTIHTVWCFFSFSSMTLYRSLWAPDCYYDGSTFHVPLIVFPQGNFRGSFHSSCIIRLPPLVHRTYASSVLPTNNPDVDLFVSQSAIFYATSSTGLPGNSIFNLGTIIVV